MASPENTSHLMVLMERLAGGDLGAREDLMKHAMERFRRLTRKMLRGFPGVRRWDETDDVLQNAMLRLFRSLEAVKPTSAENFFGLATTQIRRELLDLARHYYGPEGLGANQASNIRSKASDQLPAYEKEETTREPSRLAEWAEFHEHVGDLPEKERQVFGFLYYQGLKQEETATLLQVDVSTVQRRWLSALKKLRQVLKSGVPRF